MAAKIAKAREERRARFDKTIAKVCEMLRRWQAKRRKCKRTRRGIALVLTKFVVV